MRRRRYPVKEQLSLPGFPDEPGLYDSLETWEQFLAHVEAMPDSVQKPQTVLHAEYMIELKKEELAPMPSNLPVIVALIDPPGPFGNNLSEWQEFLADMEQLPDSVQKRQAVNNAKQMIAMKMWEYGARR
jgi:hypothetical protein